MSESQSENGYTKVANELLEAICRTNLNSYQSRVLWAIVRKTYGWNKKQDSIALSQISEMTGINKTHVCRALKELRLRNIVTQLGNKIGLNKQYSTWSELPNGVTPHRKLPNQVIKVTQPGNKALPNQAPQKKRKEHPKLFEAERLAIEFLEGIRRFKPDYKLRGSWDKWVLEFDRMLRLDKRKPELIRRVMNFARQNSFWQSNILSPAKLREQFDRLEIQMAAK